MQRLNDWLIQLRGKLRAAVWHVKQKRYEGKRKSKLFDSQLVVQLNDKDLIHDRNGVEITARSRKVIFLVRVQCSLKKIRRRNVQTAHFNHSWTNIFILNQSDARFSLYEMCSRGIKAAKSRLTAARPGFKTVCLSWSLNISQFHSCYRQRCSPTRSVPDRRPLSDRRKTELGFLCRLQNPGRNELGIKYIYYAVSP